MGGANMKGKGLASISLLLIVMIVAGVGCMATEVGAAVTADARPTAKPATPAATTPPEAKPHPEPSPSSGGLQIEIASDMTRTTADRQPLFDVTLTNVGERPVRFPAPSSFLHTARADDRHFRQPLYPIVTAVTGCTNVAGGAEGAAEEDQPAVHVLEPGEQLLLSDMPLRKREYSLWDGPDQGKVHSWFTRLLPEGTYRVSFCFENTEPKAGGWEVWTGRIVSESVLVEVGHMPFDGVEITGGFTVPKTRYFLGEPIYATFTVTNNGAEPAAFPVGGDYRATGRHDRFSFTAVDEAGNAVPDPADRLVARCGGGLVSGATLTKGKPYVEEHLVNLWCAFTRPGTYTLTCRRELNIVALGERRVGRHLFDNQLAPVVPIESKLTIEIVEDAPALEQHLKQIEKALQSGQGGTHAETELRALAEAPIEAALPLIARLVREPGPMQSRAVGWLKLYGPDNAVAPLRAAMETGDINVRISVLEALVKFEAEGCDELVLNALRSRNAAERRQAVLLCGKHPFEKCIPLLMKMTDDPDPYVRRYLGSALGACGDARAVPALLKLLHEKDTDPFIPIWAAGGLDKHGRKDGIAVLIELLRSERVKKGAGNTMSSLERLTGIGEGYTPNEWVAWWDREGREQYER